jgi:hypothetical protein
MHASLQHPHVQPGNKTLGSPKGNEKQRDFRAEAPQLLPASTLKRCTRKQQQYFPAMADSCMPD